MLVLAAGCDARETSARADGDVIVAHLDGQPVLASEVQLHLRPAPPRIGAGPAIDPRRVALDEAVRVRLLAREARRRGLAPLDGPPALVQSSLVRALVDEESARRGVPAPEAIPEDELRRFVENHIDRLDTPSEILVAAIVVTDAALAERLLAQADRADGSGFARLVAAHSIDAASRARAGVLAPVREHDHELDRAVFQVAWQLRRPGMVGLAEAHDGRWLVLRAMRVERPARPWETFAARARNLLARQRRDEVVDALMVQLRRVATLTIDERALAGLPVPAR
ncbi:peptidylprolyl isomerase [Sandaracinus amylolyticus]|uniref:peptidylprolyl isomerase n=1 Tax=Sandaracinus amylolyticus TaxID=927083 RepID=UPI001F17F9B0|nr:peptidylprolyl isomerase [Sandaracinus amylolyticus]UJR81377.1 Hypothetical protein I5071_34340 [Sandaracinus amylolyticus]